MIKPFRDPDRKKVTIHLSDNAYKRLLDMADANGMTDFALVEWVTREWIWDNYANMESKIKLDKKFKKGRGFTDLIASEN